MFNMIESYISLANLVWLVGILLVCASFLGFVGYYLAPYFSTELLLLLGWLVTGGLLGVGAFRLTGYQAVMVTFPGCLLFWLVWLYTACLVTQGNAHNTLHYLICAGVWAYFAVQVESRLIGFFAVAALFTALRFIMFALPGCTVVGFASDSHIPPAMAVAFTLVCSYSLLKVTQPALGVTIPFHVFDTGVLVMGPLVFFIGCLIVSSSWYHKDSGAYWSNNVMTLCCLALCLVFGTQLGLEKLYNFGCVFGVLFGMQKQLEWVLPQGYILTALLTGLFLCGLGMYGHVMIERLQELSM